MSEKTMIDAQEPVAGSLWKHRKGTVYRIVCCAFLERDLTTVVVYRAASDKQLTWCRPLAEFMDGRFTPFIDFTQEERKLVLDAATVEREQVI